MESIYSKLFDKGYKDSIIYTNSLLQVVNRGEVIKPNMLFFVDFACRDIYSYLFAISAPKYSIKALLKISIDKFNDIINSDYANRFDVPILDKPKELVIRREYGLRKVLLDEFDEDRYILRENFKDFPLCPYGGEYKRLGYDLKNKEYVRLERKILKNCTVKVESA
jgi:hypothetical protein